MIKVDEDDPIGEIGLSFPYRDVEIKHGVDPKEFYILDEELGSGKFGTVYRCRDKTNGLELAAKFITTRRKEEKRNVEREIEIMKVLQHPRLIQLYDAFDNGKTMCVILELIEGGELFERVIDDDFILTEKSCTVFMRQICQGIAFIHSQNILHLDMKPENILCLTRTGNRIKIIDFGLARRFDPDKHLQVLFGTPEFVAPEVVNFDDIGFGTDMWSIGVICYVLLSGLSPFMGSTDAETMANVTIGKYEFDGEAFENISDKAVDFIRKLLIKDISARMSAESCLEHEWLKQTFPVVSAKDRPSSLLLTKENLRLFVERWNEHPNSPYVFDVSTQQASDLTLKVHPPTLSNSTLSLDGMSPSPCGSIHSSSASSSPIQFLTLSSHSPTNPVRRCSDSSYFVKRPDVLERVNLADEIRRTTDKLFKMSRNYQNQSVISEIASSDSVESHLPQNWVPIQESFEEADTVKTKDLLVKLLDQWEDGQVASRTTNRFGSLSIPWTEKESLEHCSIVSLNNFFEARAAQHKYRMTTKYSTSEYEANEH